MGRLIDADALIQEYRTSNIVHHYGEQIVNKVNARPTVEAIPKDQYEQRLKADMVAMLTEIQLEIEEHKMTSGVTNQGTWNECIACCSRIIQQKINELTTKELNKKK